MIRNLLAECSEEAFTKNTEDQLCISSEYNNALSQSFKSIQSQWETNNSQSTAIDQVNKEINLLGELEENDFKHIPETVVQLHEHLNIFRKGFEQNIRQCMQQENRNKLHMLETVQNLRRNYEEFETDYNRITQSSSRLQEEIDNLNKMLESFQMEDELAEAEIEKVEKEIENNINIINEEESRYRHIREEFCSVINAFANSKNEWLQKLKIFSDVIGLRLSWEYCEKDKILQFIYENLSDTDNQQYSFSVKFDCNYKLKDYVKCEPYIEKIEKLIILLLNGEITLGQVLVLARKLFVENARYNTPKLM